MAQLGTIKLNGIEIPYFEVEDVSNPWLRVAEGDTKGALHLVPRAEADYPKLTFQHPVSGDLYAPNSSVYPIIDDFERGNLDPYFENLNAPDFFTETGTRWEGTYGLRANNGGSIYSLPGDGLRYYPTRGDAFEFYFRVYTNRDTNYTNKFRFEYGVQSAAVDNLYRLDMETEYEANSATLTFEKRVNGSNNVLHRGLIDPLPEFDTWERVRVQWDQDDTHHISWENRHGSIVKDSFSVLDTLSGDFADGGIGIFTNNGVDVGFDYIHTIPPFA